MMKNSEFSRIIRHMFCILICAVNLNSCIGFVVGAAVDTTLEVAQVPFKVAATAVDIAISDDEEKDD